MPCHAPGLDVLFAVNVILALAETLADWRCLLETVFRVCIDSGITSWSIVEVTSSEQIKAPPVTHVSELMSNKDLLLLCCLISSGKMPTVVSPELYRARFCEAMDKYFLMVPDHWTGLGINC